MPVVNLLQKLVDLLFSSEHTFTGGIMTKRIQSNISHIEITFKVNVLERRSLKDPHNKQVGITSFSFIHKGKSYRIYLTHYMVITDNSNSTDFKILNSYYGEKYMWVLEEHKNSDTNVNVISKTKSTSFPFVFFQIYSFFFTHIRDLSADEEVSIMMDPYLLDEFLKNL